MIQFVFLKYHVSYYTENKLHKREQDLKTTAIVSARDKGDPDKCGTVKAKDVFFFYQ